MSFITVTKQTADPGIPNGNEFRAYIGPNGLLRTRDYTGEVIEYYPYLETVRNDGGVPAMLADIYANRPAAGMIGRLFIATDAKIIFRDTGTSWDLLAGNDQKSGYVNGVSFSGVTKIFDVVFSIPFLDNNYSVQISGSDSRIFTVENITANGFTINTNANGQLSGRVYWIATHN